MSRVVDITGLTFGKLTVINRTGSLPNGRAAWLCRCVCGIEKIFDGAGLRHGDAKSCGCRATVVKHGHTRKRTGQSPEYKAFADAISRCENKNCPGYRLYGAVGITFDPAWRHDFEQFLADMGPRPSNKHSLDRKDVLGPYTADNCRWVVASIQCHNKRPASNTGLLNVSFENGRKRYQWSVKRDGKRVYGNTKTLIEAATERNKAAASMYPEQGQYYDDFA